MPCRLLPVLVLAGFLLLPVPPLVQAQGGSAGSGGSLEPRWIVDMPSAGMQPKSSLVMEGGFYGDGGVLLGVSIGIFDRLSAGISYGGSHLIGTETPQMNEVPGFSVKVRLLEEGLGFPALAIGFDSQGKEEYLKNLSRYRVKSPGFYAVMSKNYLLLGYFSIHGGVNYSLENADGDRDVNFFLGAEKTLGPFLSLVAEYNPALNDNDHDALGIGRGYLNVALNAALGGGLTLGINFKDLLKNNGQPDAADRTVRLEYVRIL
jgi:hypothetical protein